MTKKIRLKRKLPFVVFCVLLAVLFFSTYLLASKFLFPKHIEKEASAIDVSKEEVIIKNRISFLLLGMDARPCEKSSRTDAIMFVSFDPENKRLAVMSIPRDTRVNIPGHGFRKINEAVVYVGPELVSKIVSDLLGVPVDYYVLTNFEGFKKIVDAVGGVKFYVPQDMYYYDPADGTLIDLKKGEQLLDGDKALQFIRFRGYPNGDIDRTMHQQEFFKALAKKILQPSTVTKLHNLIPSINDAVDTNLGIVQMIKLAKAAQNFKNVEIVSQTLPGRFAEIDGISYWYVDPKEANEAVMALFRGETVDVVQGPTIIQNNKKDEKNKQLAEDNKENLKESREAEESQNANDNINVDANEVQSSSNVSNTEVNNVTSAVNITQELTIVQNGKEGKNKQLAEDNKENLKESREAEESQNANDNINVDANEVQSSSNVDNVSNTEVGNVTSNEEINIESDVNDAMADEEGWIPIPTS
ncbi:LCP family protein [Peptococcaceae bacterium]|nr:LCP family protein [Peptococcaceae bacterium]